MLMNPVLRQELSSYILLVDDRPENLLTLECVLADGKRKFVKAESGNEALKIALVEPLTLIMMDIQMPDMDGMETARLLRMNTRTRHIPILFVSAINPNEKHPIDEFEPGTADFLFKPLNLADTKAKVALFEKVWFARQEINQLKKTNERLTTSIEQFVYMVSHDLKTPLRALTNLAAWIGEDLDGTVNPNIKENLSLMKERAARMNLMIDAILEYSRTGRIQDAPQRTDVKQLVCSIFESLQPSGSFELRLDGTWPEIFTEKTKLEKVFRHLIQNALIHHDKNSGTISISCAMEGQFLRFSVADNGPGIKPIHHKTIFEMFQSLSPKNDKNTAGAGLAIAKKILDDMGCYITVEENEPRGSIFTFSWAL